MSKISLDSLDLQSEIEKIIKKYNAEKFEELETASKRIGKDAVSKLKNTTNTYNVRSGKYNKGWAMTSESGALTFDQIVYNKKHYSLTHLLENGHATANGGRTRAFKHIAPVQEQATEELYNEAIKIYGGGK